MAKGSAELICLRKEEIIQACAKLYETHSFKEISLKDIGEMTSFTRTSIYNYFQTKEEIFLSLLEKEYLLWIDSLKNFQKENRKLEKKEFSIQFSHLLDERKVLLKLLSMNHYDMEENSRMENLIAFKKVYGLALQEVRNCLHHFFPEMEPKEIENFVFSFFPFMFGIYPYTVVTDKQKEAMNKAKVNYIYMSSFELIHMQVSKLLSI